MNTGYHFPSIDAFGRRSWTIVSGHVPTTSLMSPRQVLQTLSVANVALAALGTSALLVRAWHATPEGYTRDEWWFTFPVDEEATTAEGFAISNHDASLSP